MDAFIYWSSGMTTFLEELCLSDMYLTKNTANNSWFYDLELNLNVIIN